MSLAPLGKRPFRLSLRSLMIVVGLCALLLAPLSWAIRRVELQRQRVFLAARDAERARILGRRARAEALRAAYQASLEAARSQDGAEAPAPAPRPGQGADGTPTGRGLWAALAVNHPLFRRGEAKDLTLEFTLVNDGDRALDPKVADSRLVVNGEELDPSVAFLDPGLRDDRVRTLRPNDHLRFTSALGDYFREPGGYRVRWEGERFRSPEVVFRVLPD